MINTNPQRGPLKAGESLPAAARGDASDAAGEARRPRIQSVARAASILFAIASSENGLSAREISARLRLSLQTTYHLLHTLVESGLVTRNDRKLFVVGFRACMLTEALKRHLTLPEQLAPLVRAVARDTGETANVVGWLGAEIVTLTVAVGHHPVHAAESPFAFSRNAHARASGKLLLAYAAPEMRDEYLRTHPLKKCTAHTITSLREMSREFDLIRQQQYSEDREELTLGLRCLAVPVAGGFSPYALGLAAPKERYEKNFKRYLRILSEAAASVSAGAIATGNA